MELVLSFLAGLVLAAVVAFFVLRSVKSSAAKAQTKALDDAARQAESDRKAAVASLEADLRNAKENLENAKKEAAEQTNKLVEAIERKHNKAIETERELNETALKAMKEQVQNVTNQMLKERQEDFQRSNSTNMEQIVNPLNETIKRMEKAIKENQDAQKESANTIKGNIESLVQTTLNMSNSADRLSRALTSESKVQGNWGEHKAEALLNAIGLQKGLEYDTQAFLRDASGNILTNDETQSRMQPDITLHLDETRDLIIDSKVSLTAYIDYVNAENEEQRSKALDAHMASVRNHVKELSRKNYAGNVKAPRVSVDFVMMFVPVDGALQLALDTDKELWRKAMESNVFIVGSQNLYAALQTVRVTWTTIKQDRNNKAICDTAAELINRVGDLLEKVENLGDRLKGLNDSYVEVYQKAKKGQSVLKSADELVKLGAKLSATHPLPAEDDEYKLPYFPNADDKFEKQLVKNKNKK